MFFLEIVIAIIVVLSTPSQNSVSHDCGSSHGIGKRHLMGAAMRFTVVTVKWLIDKDHLLLEFEHI